MGLFYSSRNCNKEEKIVEVEKKLDCNICFNNFDDGDNLPLNLECGHTQCKSCYELSGRKCCSCNQLKSSKTSYYLLSIINDINSKRNMMIQNNSLEQEELSVNNDLKCQNDHILKCLKERSCDHCKKVNHLLGCLYCKYFICYQCQPSIKFRNDICAVGHQLKWKAKEIICLQSCSSNRGFYCPTCEYFELCLYCCDFKFNKDLS
jgi:hypothetical protein